MSYILLDGDIITNVFYQSPPNIGGLIEVDINEPELIDGKYAVMYWQGEVKWRYDDIPKEEEIILPEPPLEIPVPLTPEQEKMKLLEQQLKQTNEDMNMFMDFVLSGGM